MTAASTANPALAFAEAQLPRCEGGDTLLVLLAAAAPKLALAAPLRSHSDRVRFLTLARYLVRREAAEGYWLIGPIERAGQPCLLIEFGDGSGCRQSLARTVAGEQRLGEIEPPAAGKPLLGDLFASGERLSGILRRQLDQLTEAISIAPP